MLYRLQIFKITSLPVSEVGVVAPPVSYAFLYSDALLRSWAAVNRAVHLMSVTYFSP